MRRLRYARWPPLRSVRDEDRLRANERKRPASGTGKGLFVRERCNLARVRGTRWAKLR